MEVPLEATDITVGWFFNCQQLQNDSCVVIVSETQLESSIRRIISRLTISDITDDYTGEYTCNILGDEEYIPSDIFMLPDQEYLEVDIPLGPCPNNGDVLSFSGTTGEKCADITENRTIPLSLSCEEPPSTTSQQLHITSTPVPIRRTPSPPLPSITPNPPHPTSSSSTTHTQHTATNTPSSSPDPTDMTSSPDSLDSVSLYLIAVVSVLVLVIILLVLTFSLVKVCTKQSHRTNPQCKPVPSVIRIRHKFSIENLFIPHAVQVNRGEIKEPYYDFIQETPVEVASSASTHFSTDGSKQLS